MTKNQRSFDSAVMMSSLKNIPAPPLILMKGRTAIAGRSSSGSAARGSEFSSPAAARCTGCSALEGMCTSPTKRNSLRGTVRISFCSSPLSPRALRAALMRLVNV
jgi:hypothetical protein